MNELFYNEATTFLYSMHEKIKFSFTWNYTSHIRMHMDIERRLI